MICVWGVNRLDQEVLFYCTFGLFLEQAVTSLIYSLSLSVSESVNL